MVGDIGFRAAAWKVVARDRRIGWDVPCRTAHLGRVLNNARFLLLPWVQVKHLASIELALAAPRLPEDFDARYDEQWRPARERRTGCGKLRLLANHVAVCI